MRGTSGPLPRSAALWAALLLTVCGAARADAGTVRRVDRGETPGSTPTLLTVAGDSLYFTADDGVHGRELWCVDRAGTVRLAADALPGPEGSEPSSLVADAGGALYAVAYTSPEGRAMGSGQVLHVSGAPPRAHAVGGLIAHTPERPTRLARLGGAGVVCETVSRVDGQVLTRATPAGTLELRTFPPATMGSIEEPHRFMGLFGQRLLFTAATPKRYGQVWATDGTQAGTQPMTEAFGASRAVAYADCLVPIGDRVFFCTSSIETGREPWVLDAEGPRSLADVNPGRAGSAPADFAAFGDGVLFRADDGQHGPELWFTDGTQAGTRLVCDIRPGPEGSGPYYMRDLGEMALFCANDGEHGCELWRTDGTAAGTALVKDLHPGPGESNPYQLLVFGDVLLFACDVPGIGEELWRSDGTADGTTLVKDIHAGPGDAEPYYLTEFAGCVYFSARDAAHGEELWRTDGTEARTQLAADIAPRMRVTRSSNPSGLTASGGRVFFAADDLAHGEELWCSVPEAPGAVLVRDIRPGREASAPRDLTVFAGGVAFAADDGVCGRELWFSDGTDSGTRLAADLLEGAAGSNPRHLVRCGEDVCFVADTAAGGEGLFRLETLDAAPGLAAQLPEHARTVSAKAFDGVLYLCREGVRGRLGFMRYDAAADALTPMGAETPRPGAFEALRQAPELDPAEALRCYLAVPGTAGGQARFGTVHYFAAYTPAYGVELWKGADLASAALVLDAYRGPASGGPSELTAVGPMLFFTAEGAACGRELWRLDTRTDEAVLCTEETTQGRRGTNPGALAAVWDGLMLARPNGIPGVRHLAGVGPSNPRGPRFVQSDLPCFVAPLNPAELTVVGDHVYFAAEDVGAGRELWRTDGTGNGTQRVVDIARDAFYEDALGVLTPQGAKPLLHP